MVLYFSRAISGDLFVSESVSESHQQHSPTTLTNNMQHTTQHQQHTHSNTITPAHLLTPSHLTS